MRIWFAASPPVTPPYSLRWSMRSLADELRHFGHTVSLIFPRAERPNHPVRFSWSLAFRLVVLFWKRPQWIITHSTDGLPCAFFIALFRMKTRIALFTDGWDIRTIIIERRLPRSLAAVHHPWHRRLRRDILLRLALSRSALCLCGTFDELRWIRKHLISSRGKCILIPTGVPVRKQPFWPNQEAAPPSFLLTGEYHWKKNIEYGIELFRRVLAINKAARLFYVGCGQTSEKLRQLLYPLGDAVFTVESEASAKMYRWYESCPFLLLPSRFEAQRPPVILEAQSRGCIVFAADIPPVRECLSHGHTGFLISGVNPVADANLVQRVIGDYHLIIQVGNAAWKRTSRQNIRRQGTHLLRALIRTTVKTLRTTGSRSR
jgi:glycosyltransferase involved in cell wall biosynthesis